MSNPCVLMSLKRIEPPAKRHDKGGPDEAVRTRRFVKGFGTSDDACGIHGCALLSHLFAACPWWSRIGLLAGPPCFAASSVAVPPHALPPYTVAERLQKLWRRWKNT
jgi:hypothetical protein